MTVTSLASSSHGNAYVVSDGETKLLLECGLTWKRLQRALGFAASELAGCLVSHEHKDHSRCAGKLLDMGVPVYLSQGTAAALLADGTLSETQVAAARELSEGVTETVGSFLARPFATFHDAAEPLGFLIRSRADGELLAFATDTVNLGYRFPGVTILAVEANYDRALLDGREQIPEKVRQRIARTHMEIGTLCGYLKSLELSGCREILLLHLSDSCSQEWAFVEQVKRVVPAGIAVHACPKEGNDHG